MLHPPPPHPATGEPGPLLHHLHLELDVTPPMHSCCRPCLFSIYLNIFPVCVSPHLGGGLLRAGRHLMNID